jgi:methionyl aminopeptidase
MILNNNRKSSKPLQIDDYLKVGKIAAEVRENTRKKNWIGSTLEEICE